ncbi:thiopurine S-methyltransferase [Achromobacter mucicolens]|jgi:thiopurine S-methyltransferase|uniref:Thiopurine S-methyltransferase n=1 Tax=Achromobacter mucicolens TaxID=1389922 RepID=A0ABD4YYT9_9BURK|nr:MULTISPECIES: thiopurine S-methyltransferase [Achromobacter]KRB09851.1 thiopurine S-methyltransferase [Achromobacter sp. Root170]MDF2863453.1 thiopurine S-methyltransferase [Achromobacter mucicolens]MDH0091761.1 thiopurine S-methyltransferase [Achromobacter mucicolens]MDH1180244.1 thiopurine S-methyltransferase [Achromobacter mucicolens]TQJ96975.1 thiopurine S-methyltransferase [Achromobacter sp. SLBN-14]
MDAEFWLERWREGRTHFHQTRVTPLLQKYWPSLDVPKGGKVLVPLCGKSLDMVWLAAQGHQVLGAELSKLAVEQFFDENELRPVIHDSVYGTHYVAGNIEIVCGDIFKLDAQVLSHCVGVYDRAALVALPDAMRADYVRHVYGQLSPSYRGLLITLDYPQEEMAGPPFSVVDSEVQAIFSGVSPAVIIDRRDILDKEPKFQSAGVSRLDTVVYRLGVQA